MAWLLCLYPHSCNTNSAQNSFCGVSRTSLQSKLYADMDHSSLPQQADDTAPASEISKYCQHAQRNIMQPKKLQKGFKSFSHQKPHFRFWIKKPPAQVLQPCSKSMHLQGSCWNISIRQISYLSLATAWLHPTPADPKLLQGLSCFSSEAGLVMTKTFCRPWNKLSAWTYPGRIHGGQRQ